MVSRSYNPINGSPTLTTASGPSSTRNPATAKQGTHVERRSRSRRKANPYITAVTRQRNALSPARAMCAVPAAVAGVPVLSCGNPVTCAIPDTEAMTISPSAYLSAGNRGAARQHPQANTARSRL
jgi:hypothetical protein